MRAMVIKQLEDVRQWVNQGPQVHGLLEELSFLVDEHMVILDDRSIDLLYAAIGRVTGLLDQGRDFDEDEQASIAGIIAEAIQHTKSGDDVA